MESTVLFAAEYWLTLWATPLWLLAWGVVAGLVAVAVVWGLVALLSRVPGVRSVPLFSRRTATEFPELIQEGPLWPMLWIALLVGSVSFLAISVRKPGEYWNSFFRVRETGTFVTQHEVPPASTLVTADAAPDKQFITIPVSFRRSELNRLELQSSEGLSVRATVVDLEKDKQLAFVPVVEVAANQPRVWRPAAADRPRMFPTEEVRELYIKNHGNKPAQLKLTIVTQPPVPEVATVPITAIGVLSVFLVYFLQRTFFPRVSAIALATFKSETAQPLFPLIAIIGSVLLLLFVVVPYHTFGEDIKMLKDSGLTLIMVASIIQAVWGASTSIAEEIEGRTALTVLSKPLNRQSFIVGKFLGISWTVALMFMILGLLFLVTVCYKPIYDVAEGSIADEPTWQICHWEMVGVVPGLLLAFMETITLTAISVAISTRLPMFANFVITFTIYVLGNLTPMIVQSSAGQFPIVKFMGQLIAVVVPNLENYNIQAAIAGGQVVPLGYLGFAAIYCLIGTLIAMFVALLMFEDRDLA